MTIAAYLPTLFGGVPVSANPSDGSEGTSETWHFWDYAFLLKSEKTLAPGVTFIPA